MLFMSAAELALFISNCTNRKEYNHACTAGGTIDLQQIRPRGFCCPEQQSWDSTETTERTACGNPTLRSWAASHNSTNMQVPELSGWLTAVHISAAYLALFTLNCTNRKEYNNACTAGGTIDSQ